MQRLYPENTFVAPKYGGSTRLVIAEAPGEDEAIKGEPLVGGAGRWFDSMARQAGLHRDQLNLINVMNCRPPNNVFPTDPAAKSYISSEEGEQSVQHCLNSYVRPLLHGRPWTRIDLLGDKALEYVGGKSEGIFKWRGSPLALPDLGGDKPIAIATLHPAYIARDQELIPCVINDLRKNIVPPPERYSLQPTMDEVRAFQYKEVCFDIETRGWTKEITMIGISGKPYEVLLVPFRGPYLAELKRIFNEATSVVGQNIVQFDLPVMADSNLFISQNCEVWDIMLMQHLLFPSFPHDLEFIGSQFSSKPAWKHLKNADEPLYCCRDVDVTIQAFRQLLPMLRSAGMESLYKLVQVPLGKICKLMTDTGFTVDPAHITKVREELIAKMEEEELKLPEQLRTYQHPVNKRELAPPGTLSEKTGKPIKYVTVQATKTVVPWRSPDKKQEYLYGSTEPWMLGLPEQFDVKSGNVTTGKNALDKLFRRTKIPALQAIKKLNQWDELITTFCKETMTRATRMHPSFNVHGTASGRLSSSNPNLQNIPESARYIYVPSTPGWKILECVAPATRLLYSDLKWKQARDVQVGDELIGFDEEGPRRKLQRSIVTNTSRLRKYSFLVKTTKGQIRVSANHGWLKKNPNKGSNFEWCHTTDLKEGDAVGYFRAPWKQSDNVEDGWIAGILDGEGYVSRKHQQVGFGQNDGEVYETMLARLATHGFICNSKKTTTGCNQVLITGEPFAGMRVLGQFRPIRLLSKAGHLWEGRQVWGKLTEPAIVTKILDFGEQEVCAIETSSHTFIAEGFLSHNCDYSQIENRLTAYFAGDHDRLARFVSDPKFSEHKYATSIFLGIPYDEVEKSSEADSPYKKAKGIVHGTNFGEGSKKIALLNDFDYKETKELHDKWKNEIRATIVWQNSCAEQAKRQGYLANPFSRRRLFYTSSYYTESLSFLPQSSAADIIFRAMIAMLYERIGWPIEKVQKIVQVYEPLPMPARLLLQVHDSLLFEYPPEIEEQLINTVRRVMEQPFPELGGMSIPIGIKTGASWGEVEDYN